MVREWEAARVYPMGLEAATEVFEAAKGWPKEARYALTGQIRRPSQAVCSNVAEAWPKRRDERPFVSKPTDAEGEAAETQVWLQGAHRCGYLDPEFAASLRTRYDHPPTPSPAA